MQNRHPSTDAGKTAAHLFESKKILPAQHAGPGRQLPLLVLVGELYGVCKSTLIMLNYQFNSFIRNEYFS